MRLAKETQTADFTQGKINAYNVPKDIIWIGTKISVREFMFFAKHMIDQKDFA